MLNPICITVKAYGYLKSIFWKLALFKSVTPILLSSHIPSTIVGEDNIFVIRGWLIGWVMEGFVRRDILAESDCSSLFVNLEVMVLEGREGE